REPAGKRGGNAEDEAPLRDVATQLDEKLHFQSRFPLLFQPDTHGVALAQQFGGTRNRGAVLHRHVITEQTNRPPGVSCPNAMPSRRVVINSWTTLARIISRARVTMRLCGAVRRSCHHSKISPAMNTVTCKTLRKVLRTFDATANASSLSASSPTLRTLVKVNFWPVRGISMRMGRMPWAIGPLAWPRVVAAEAAVTPPLTAPAKTA